MSTVKLFVGNVSESTTAGELRALFEPFGEVAECSKLRDIAFVHYTTLEAANEAIRSLDKYVLNGRSMNVLMSNSGGGRGRGRYMGGADRGGLGGGGGGWGVARGRGSGGGYDDFGPRTKLHVTGYPEHTTKEDLYELFTAYGEITEIAVMKNFSFVHFVSPESARLAKQEKDGIRYRELTLSVQFSKNTEGARINPNKPIPTKLFVGGLAADMTDDDLRAVFEKFGNVTEATVLRDKSIGFVHFSSERDADTAVESMDGKQLNGKYLRVQFSTGVLRKEGFDAARAGGGGAGSAMGAAGLYGPPAGVGMGMGMGRGGGVGGFGDDDGFVGGPVGAGYGRGGYDDRRGFAGGPVGGGPPRYRDEADFLPPYGQQGSRMGPGPARVQPGGGGGQRFTPYGEYGVSAPRREVAAGAGGRGGGDLSALTQAVQSIVPNVADPDYTEETLSTLETLIKVSRMALLRKKQEGAGVPGPVPAPSGGGGGGFGGSRGGYKDDYDSYYGGPGDPNY